MKRIVLVAGGAGYIGSHMVRALLEAGYYPVVFDNLSTGHAEMIAGGAMFFRGDLRDREDVESVFRNFSFHAVMHFAASSVVPESVREPLRYYQNNTGAFLNLLEVMQSRGVNKLIFSSTAAVYGQPSVNVISEDCPAQPINPYGSSKRMMEQIARDQSFGRDFSCVIFRYFNAAGAHEDGTLGECHSPETHLIPNLLSAVLEQNKEFTLFGTDYPTPDGTCVRDYVHVQDLCRAHLLGLRYLENGGKNEIFNLGSQKGYSVQEVLRAVEKVSGRKVPVKIAERRAGDPPQLIADSGKAEKILGWRTEENLESIVRSAYQWHQNQIHEKSRVTHINVPAGAAA